jgi:hypothetical protein
MKTRHFTDNIALSISIFLLLAFSWQQTAGQSNTLEVTDVVTPEELVGILIGGGVETSNITYTGAPIARGKFWNGPGNVGIEDGVLLTSGSVFIAPGPNNSGSAGSNNGAAGDPDLQSISGVSSHNACILEFDFVPQSSLVSFRYVFASEEYHEFAGAGVNDAFGFFISGPGINGQFSNNSINIALIPLSTTYVSINTVNNGTSNQGPCTNCQFFVHNSQQFTQYDAFTTVLTAFAYVTPCETYHIKLAIGDGGDGIYDSGVFLEANSFSSQGVTNEISFDYGQYHQHAIEGCNTASVLFELAEQTDFDYWMPLIIEGSATNGIDYLELPDSVFFPIGYSQATVEVIPFEDGESEWAENVNLIYNSSLCGINYDTAVVQIRDYGPLTIETTGDTTINCNTSATIGVTDIGGHGPYTVVWSTGDTTDSISVSPLITTTYYVTVLGLCDSTNTDSVRVVVDGPKANAGNDQSIPYGTTTTLEGGATQGSGSYEYAWEPAALLDDPTSPIPTTVNMELTTIFTLTVTDQAGGCQDADEVLVQVTGGPLGVNPGAAPSAICYGESTELSAFASGGTEEYTYSWSSDPPGFESELANPVVFPDETTTYFVTVNDGFNVVNGQVTVDVLPLPEPDAGEDVTIPHGTTTQLNGSGIGGSGSYEYYWEPEDKLLNPNAPNPTTVKLYESTLFRLTVVDANSGCISSEEDLMTVVIDGGPLTVVATAEDSVICDGDGTQLLALGSGGDFPNYNYRWSSIPAGFNTTEPEPLINPLSTTTYVVEIDDGFNLDYDTITIDVSSLPPVNLGTDRMACPYDSVELDVALPGMSYYWSNGSTAQSIKVGSTGIGYDVKNLWVEVEDELGCVGVDSIQIIFDFSQCFGIEESAEPLYVQLFPNPSNGVVKLSIEGEKGIVDIKVMNNHGQTVYTHSGDIDSRGLFEQYIDLSSHPAGIYFVKVYHDERLFTGKLLVK